MRSLTGSRQRWTFSALAVVFLVLMVVAFAVGRPIVGAITAAFMVGNSVAAYRTRRAQ